ncbi:MAG: hypothetical protein K9K67_16295 [Bacteriovoracaceae bacterium]|nr:hypothetical protein [Bacteriovoracaceae bacterium]
MYITSNEDQDNLETLNNFDFFKFFWEKYGEESGIRLSKYRQRLTMQLETERPVLTKDDLYTIEKFVDHLDRDVFPKFTWNSDGSHEPFSDPLLVKLKSIVGDLSRKYNTYH